ncbi:endolytic transglycosylase MltG [Xanthobacter sp. V3C-3]|uniref:endolytic transglycosylase MltG n=1 Tax=Xanthobacter lutulentifluminis TaxID=3119935 RepID=UPI00372634E2
MAESNDGSPKSAMPDGVDPHAAAPRPDAPPAAAPEVKAPEVKVPGAGDAASAAPTPRVPTADDAPAAKPAPEIHSPLLPQAKPAAGAAPAVPPQAAANPAGAPATDAPASAAQPAAKPAGKATAKPAGRAARKAEAEAAKALRPSRSARHPAVTILSGLFTFLLFLGVGGGLAVWYAERAFYDPGPLTAEKVVNIPRGAGVRDMGDILEREGVISNWLLFVVGQRLTREDAKLQAGEYVFKPGQSAASVIDTIASGKVVQHQVTIPEGLTSQQVVKRLMDNDLLTGTPAVPPEGTLLPETYRIRRGQPREEVLQQMAEAQRKLLATIWAKRASDLPVRTPQELVVLASIVEKETGLAEERPKVAAVFVNRLNKKMRLQSDPTIIYGIVGGRGSLGRPITRTDISTPTAYNTYAVDGLPPGPICNPGRDALMAVANPPRTKDLFFVADGTGGHAFAETLNDHNKNVARWRAIEQGNAAPASPGAQSVPPPVAPAGQGTAN